MQYIYPTTLTLFALLIHFRHPTDVLPVKVSGQASFSVSPKISCTFPGSKRPLLVDLYSNAASFWNKHLIVHMFIRSRTTQ